MSKDKNKEVQPAKPVAAGAIHAPDETRRVLNGKRFVFTSAQNNTFVHTEFLKSLKSYCLHNEAELIVSPFTYNKNGFQNGEKSDDSLWYDPEIREYLLEEDVFVTEWKDLVFCGSLNILPTAVRPMSGLNNYCRSASGIIPHAKQQMQSLPTMKNDPARMLYTTGAVTQRNYVQKKAGQKAEFHHIFGALVVEVCEDTGDWFCRQLVGTDSGRFQDLNTIYYPEGYTYDAYVEAIQWGDLHAEKREPWVDAISWEDPSSILDTLRPKYQFVHDLTDFTARNHHNINDPHFLAKAHFTEKSSVKNDLITSGASLLAMHREYCKTVLVDSNHDQALELWLKTAHKSIVRDPENAWLFHTLNAWVMQQLEEGKSYNVYEYAIKMFSNVHDVLFLKEDDSFLICQDTGGIECSLHGHRGPNGARGAPNNLNNIGRKINTGHTHSAGIIDGTYTAGVSGSLEMDYNKGPSSWSHSHIVTLPNGKRQIITLKNGKWRA